MLTNDSSGELGTRADRVREPDQECERRRIRQGRHSSLHRGEAHRRREAAARPVRALRHHRKRPRHAFIYNRHFVYIFFLLEENSYV